MSIALVPEAAICLPVAEHWVVRAQIAELGALAAAEGDVTICLLPLSASMQAAATGPATILQVGGPAGLAVAHLPGPQGGMFLDQPDDVAACIRGRAAQDQRAVPGRVGPAAPGPRRPVTGAGRPGHLISPEGPLLMTGTITTHPATAPASGTETGDTAGLLAGLSPALIADALAFLACYSPAVFGTVLAATEPSTASREPEAEPFCTVCSARAGIFLSRSRDWMHYRGDGVTEAEPYEAGHDIVIGWRAASDGQ